MKADISHLKAREAVRIAREGIPIRLLPHLCLEVIGGHVFLRTEKKVKE